MLNNFANIFKFRPRAAFTLVEVVTALFIIMVGIFGGYELVNKSIVAAKSISMRLTAVYLGKEGVEIVKSIRDTNYLKIHYGADGAYTWTNGLAAGGVPSSTDCTIPNGGCIAQSDSSRLSNVNDTDVNQPLKYSDSTGFGYLAGNVTAYKRKITITPQVDYLNVVVTVTWSEHGNDHATVVRENIYNWWQE